MQKIENDIQGRWGTQLSHRNTIVTGLSLAFCNLTDEDKDNLIEIKQLFNSTQANRGTLADITPSYNLVDIANSFLLTNNGNLMSYVKNVSMLWDNETKTQLEILALMVSLDDFLLLSDNLHYKKILEAFWRAKRNEFKFTEEEPFYNGIDELKQDMLAIIDKLHNIKSIINDLQEIGIENIKLGTYGTREYEIKEAIVDKVGSIKKLNDFNFNTNVCKAIQGFFIKAVTERIRNCNIESIYHSLNRLKERKAEIDMLKRNLLNTIENENDSISNKLRDELTNDFNLNGSENDTIDSIDSFFDDVKSDLREIENEIEELNEGKLQINRLKESILNTIENENDNISNRLREELTNFSLNVSENDTINNINRSFDDAKNDLTKIKQKVEEKQRLISEIKYLLKNNGLI